VPPSREPPFAGESERPKAMTLPFTRSLADALAAIVDPGGSPSKTETGLPFAASAPKVEKGLPFASSAPKAEGGLPFQQQAKAEGGLPFQKAPTMSPESLPFGTTGAHRLSESAVFPVPPPPIAPPPMAPPPIAPPPVVAPPKPSSPAIDSPWANASAQRPLPPAAAPAPALVSSPSFDARGVSALDASNAASAPWTKSAAAVAPITAPAPREQTSLRVAPRPDPSEAIQLLWYDPECLPRIRRVPRWQQLLREMSDKPLDADLDDPALAADPMELEDRREVFELLAVAEPADAQGVEQTLSSAIRPDGKFLPQLNLLAGELQLPFDELETLKATVTTAAPLVGQDESLKLTVEVAKEFLRTPGLLSSAATAEGLTNRIKESFGAGRRMVPAGYLEQQVERVLLEKRAYSRREVFGARHLRGLLHQGGSSTPVPTYLPESLANKLPMFQRFKVRMVVEVDFTVDQYEAHQAALKTVAIARLMSASPRR
jgi:hypothetical protein